MDRPESLVPEQLKRMLTLTLTLVAIVLYAAILMSAMVSTLTRQEPMFSDNMERAAGLLSGLVGAVVTAGFARSKRPVATPIAVPHPISGETAASWWRLRPPSRASRNLDSLGDVLGLTDLPGAPLRSAPSTVPGESGEGEEEEEPAPAPMPIMSVKIWVALLYVLVYMLVGLAAFIVAIWWPSVPDIIANSAWVWFGTLISSAYSFFGLEAQA
ncbi:MAG: hypothetical protein H5T69_05610 [Chloroflexi bacterium]|nr:hypothetical protein [Chloroflexota bacterium]